MMMITNNIGRDVARRFHAKMSNNKNIESDTVGHTNSNVAQREMVGREKKGNPRSQDAGTKENAD